MTISRKLNKSLSTALITLLVLSTFIGLISFANAATVSSPSTLAFSKTGAGSYVWSTAQADSGDFSVRMRTTTAATDSVEIKLPTNFLLGTNGLGTNNFSAMVYPVATSVGLDGNLTMKVYMDSDGNGNADYYFNLTATAPSDGAWDLWSSSSWKVQNMTTGSTNVRGVANGVIDTYANWNGTAGFAADTVVSVSVILSATGSANTVYVDSITAGVNTYNLEPVALTLNQASATSQQAAPKAPTSDTVQVFAANATYNNGELVTVFFQGTAVASGTATANGGFSGTFVVPAVSAGTYTITALGVASGRTFTATLEVATPTVSVNPTAATAGSTVTITGADFQLSGKVNMTFNGSPWYAANATDTNGNYTVSATGTTSIVAVIPTLPTGTYNIVVTDGLNAKSTTFVIPVPTITLSPASGPVAKTLGVQGMGFTRGGLIQIYFGGSLAWSTSADATGNLTGISIPVPDKVAGAYNVQVVDVSTGLSSNTATFTVSAPSIKVVPVTGQVGSNFIINGTNFKVGFPVNVKFNGISLANITTTANPSSIAGSFANATLAVPSVVPGTYIILADDGVNSAQVSYVIPQTTLTLTPNAGPTGTTFYVAGTNFKVSSTITITFNGTTMTNSATTNATGFFNQSQTVPAGYPIGAFTVNATDGVTFATATFNVGAAITSINATSGPVGSGIILTGLGFSNSGTVQIFFDSTLIKTVNATSTGALPATASFVVPDVMYGAHQVTAIDVVSGVITPIVTYTILRPTIVLTPTENQVGTMVMVTGASYKLDSTVSIYFNNQLVATLTATHAGALPADANFTVPSVVPGQYTVNATDSANFRTATFNVYGTGGVDQVLTIVTEIRATLAENGNFYNLTVVKLGTFMGNDTVASLLYSIQSKVALPSELKFDFGGEQRAWQPGVTHITPTTMYGSPNNWGWTSTAGLDSRDRGTSNPALTGFVLSSQAKTFQVALPNGNYVVLVTQSDAAFAHDRMTISANGGTAVTVNLALGGSVQTSLPVTVEDGLLQLTFGKAAGAVDPNWVVNGVTIMQAP